ncbi:MAG: S1 RNA-binding domain-containing protein [Candidatus Promineifilaceae bacterium]|nr:S1 RNA-binding domain-containing protein [Candidatus Promineifilaceae bacterium]
MEDFTQTPGATPEDSNSMAFYLDQDLGLDLPQAGDFRYGEVVEHLKNAILVDIGAKSEGVIAGSELDTLSAEEREELAVGNEVYVYVVNPEDEAGNVVLSYARAAEEKDWQTVQRLLESGETYEGEAVGYNKGGLLVEVGRLRGFMPISQLSPGRNMTRSRPASEQLQEIVGETVVSKVIEVDRERNRLILSERAATREQRAAQRERLMEELEEGQTREGRVVNLTDFGAFVDIGGVEGLVHISEISWKRVGHPRDVLEVGDRVRVAVLDVDHERQRIALSLKRLETDPWTIVDEIYEEGQLVEATVTKLTQFGAFARIEDEYGLEGLIHISEMSEGHVNHPRDIVQSGDVVTVRIIRVDPEQRQIGLSLKEVSSPRYMETDLALAVPPTEDASRIEEAEEEES